jgi:Zn-dependent protease with chaperone function
MKAFALIIPLLLLQINTVAIALSTATAKVPLKGISASQFRHPLDRQLTSAIQNAPFHKIAEGAIRSSFSLVEQGVRLNLLSSAVKVSEDQLPELYEAMQSAARVLDMSSVPELYVQSSSQANAYTLALESKSGSSPPIVVITSTLLERCSNEEIQAIIGHELGHLKCSHSLYLTLGGLVSSPFRSLPIIGTQTEQLLQNWRLAAEYSCDRAALLVAQDVDVVAGAMLKLFAGTNKVSNTRAFMEQAREYERLLKDANPLVRMSVGMQSRTHPLPVKRVVELEKWADSKEYKQLLGIESV